jgi:hypothetical protein
MGFMKLFVVDVRVVDQFQPKVFFEDRTFALDAETEEEARETAQRVAMKHSRLAAPGRARVMSIVDKGVI